MITSFIRFLTVTNPIVRITSESYEPVRIYKQTMGSPFNFKVIQSILINQDSIIRQVFVFTTELNEFLFFALSVNTACNDPDSLSPLLTQPAKILFFSNPG